MDQTDNTDLEKLVGITQFLNQGKPIECLFKQRFSDFVVNEVTPQLDVVVLKNPDLWKEFASVKESHNRFLHDKNAPKENPFETFELKPNFEEESKELLGDEVTGQLLHLVDLLKENPNMRHFEVKVPLPESKDDRMKIHNFIRDHLPFLDSCTRNSKNAKKNLKATKGLPTAQDLLTEYILIQVTPVNFKRFKTNINYGEKQQIGKFVHFTLMKRNIDSINAGMYISKFLGVSHKHFQMAGIKDKRGVTTQKSSLQGITIEQLQDIQERNNWNKNLVISDCHYSNEGLGLGDLYGNRFAITLRIVGNVQTSQKWDIVKNIEALKQYGFVNFFGLQRFGVNRDIKTHDIGREVIKQNWKNVFEFILKSACSSDPATRVSIEQYLQEEPKQHKKLLRSLSQKLRIERTLVQALDNAGTNNYLAAFLMLPRNAREIYAHAYQSYLWNKMASARIELSSKDVLLGDLVLKNEDNDEMVQDADVEEIDIDDQEVEVAPVKQSKETKPSDTVEPTLVTSENISLYTIRDVVFPMYGQQTDLPNSSIALRLFEEILLSESVLKEDFVNISQKFILKGGFRKLICYPENLTHEIISYTTKDQDLLSPFHDKFALVDQEGGKYTALVIKFTLKKSAYATMLIRELTKYSSSLEHQQKITAAYNLM